jgi:integrase
MSKSKCRKKKAPKRVLALPDLEHAKTVVLNSLTSVSGQRTYDHAIREFVTWVIADLVGKGGHVRTVPIPIWVKSTVDAWLASAAITRGPVFRAINKAGRVWGDGMSPKVLWDVVRTAAARAGIDKLAPHDLRRTCARLCHLAGGELDQIQFLLGHVSIQTTERYLGCKQKLRTAVNDRLGIEPDAA